MELLVELASESRSAFTRHSRGEGEGQGGDQGAPHIENVSWVLF